MNHDDEKNPNLQAWIEPELEARLVAAVLGETSAFETAELDRLIGEKPELGIFKRRIEAVHGLVGLATRPEQAPLRLAPERRAKILQTIGAASARPPGAAANAPVLLALATARRKRRKKWIWMSGLAASLMFAALLTIRVASSRISESDRELERAVMSQRKESNSEYRQRSMVALPAVESANAAAPDDQVAALSPFKVSRPTLSDRVRQALKTPLLSRPEEKRGDEARAEGDRRGQKAQNESRDFAWGGGALEGSAPVSFFQGGAGKPAASAPPFGIELKNKIAIDTLASLSDSKERQRDFAGVSKQGRTDFYINPKNLAAPSLPAETVFKDEVSGETVVMSPFEVSAGRDGGYAAAASQQISGSRVDTTLYGSSASLALTAQRKAFLRGMEQQKLDDAMAAERNDGFLAGGDAQHGKIASVSKPTSPAAVDERLSREKAAASTPPPPASRPNALRGEINATQEAVSTFSLHVSDVSFRLAQAALARGETPDPTRIRPEEFYNAFDYGDPAPAVADKIVCRIEQAAHPLLQQRNLVRIAMKVPSSGRGAGQPLHLTVLLDTSGSMEREDRITSVRRALEVLASLLGANDRVTLIGFARQARLLAEQIPGNQAATLADLASHTPFTGGTNLEEALKLSGELARRHRDPAAQNRIVLITDGAANLGNADPAQLATMIETLRQQGIAFDACGVGTDGLDDAILESLTRKGDGRYYVLDKPEDADAGFARQLAGAFRPAAENVKVQVRFNPARVGSYRLIGFEQHRLREEDFRNDQVDAAELAADEAAVALYQVEVLPQGEGELGEVFVRFRDAAAGTMVERSWTMLHEPHARAFDRATPTMQLAGTAALLAEKLEGGDTAKLIDLGDLTSVVNGLRGHYANDVRVQQLVAMFEQMRRREGK